MKLKIAVASFEKSLQNKNSIISRYSEILSQEVLDGGGTPEYILSQQKLCNILADEKKLWKRIRFNHDQFMDIRDKFEQASRDDPESPLFSEDQWSDPGNRCLLSREQVVFLIILQLRTAARQCDLAAEFGVEQPTISRYLMYAKPVMLGILPTADAVQRRVQDAGKAELELLIPNSTLMIDGTYTPYHRDPDYETQKKYYTLKKKRHAANTAVIINENGLIVFLGPAHEGSTHDMTVIKEDDPDLGTLTARMISEYTRAGSRPTVYVDLGYFGLQKVYPGCVLMIPFKKPKDRELTATEKKYNKRISKIRIRVEHAIGRLKNYGVLTATYDGTLDQLHTDMMIISGLVNYKRLWDHKLKKLKHNF